MYQRNYTISRYHQQVLVFRCMNYSNYTLGGLNILQNTDLNQDHAYNNYVTNHIINYRSDYAKEMKEELDSFTIQKSINDEKDLHIAKADYDEVLEYRRGKLAEMSEYIKAMQGKS